MAKYILADRNDLGMEIYFSHFIYDYGKTARISAAPRFAAASFSFDKNDKDVAIFPNKKAALRGARTVRRVAKLPKLPYPVKIVTG